VSNALQIVDYLNYAALPANYSYGDVPDGQPFYRQNLYHSTPAATNDDALPPITVSINEWMAENTGFLLDPGTSNYDDWFELYNHSDNPAELAGYYLTDDLNNPLQYQIPAGYRVPAHGFLLVWADGKPSANNTNSADLHVNFKLNKDGEAIGLFAPDGTAIDALTFGPQTANVSEGRYPDGGSGRFFMPTPTPRVNNVIPNSAPVLATIGGQEVTLGQTLTFRASATDTDQPPQTLTFSLGAGAAGNATINAASGLFSWTPTTAPSTNFFSIIVTDNGSPALNATQTFAVTVYPPPMITVEVRSSQIQLAWPRGTLQHADEVNGPYFDIPGATSPYAPTPSATRQFYRVRM